MSRIGHQLASMARAWTPRSTRTACRSLSRSRRSRSAERPSGLSASGVSERDSRCSQCSLLRGITETCSLRNVVRTNGIEAPAPTTDAPADRHLAAPSCSAFVDLVVLAIPDGALRVLLVDESTTRATDEEQSAPERGDCPACRSTRKPATSIPQLPSCSSVPPLTRRLLEPVDLVWNNCAVTVRRSVTASAMR